MSEVNEMEFSLNWRQSMLVLLEEKQAILKYRIQQWDHTEGDNLKFVNCKIELAHVEAEIFYKKMEIVEYKKRVESPTKQMDSESEKEAKENFESILQLIKQHAPDHERLQHLLQRYSESVLTEERKHILYLHFKRALQDLKLI